MLLLALLSRHEKTFRYLRAPLYWTPDADAFRGDRLTTMFVLFTFMGAHELSGISESMTTNQPIQAIDSKRTRQLLRRATTEPAIVPLDTPNNSDFHRVHDIP